MEITVLASGSKGNCYHVQYADTQILIECGIPWKKIQQKLNFKTSSLNGCLVSHSHKDHGGYAKDAIKAGIDLYCHADTANELNLSGHRLKTVEPQQVTFRVGDLLIMPFELEHDVTNLGYLIVNDIGEKLVFITDSFYCRYKFVGITHLMIECNYADDILRANVDAGLIPTDLKNRLLKSHFSLENVKEFLRANDMSKVREIHLIHLSENNAHPERFKREIQELCGKPTFIAGGE